MASLAPQSNLVEGFSEIQFNDPALTPEANEAVGTLLTLTRRDYAPVDKVKNETKVAMFAHEAQAAIDALFFQPPFDSNPSWVLSVDQPPFLQGDNLLSLVYRSSFEEQLFAENHMRFTHQKILALTEGLLRKNVPGDITEDEGKPNPNSPFTIYMDRFGTLDDTQDFTVMEMLTKSMVERLAKETAS